MEFATPPTFTGNPGQPRDLQFRAPFLEMFFDRSAAEWRDLRFPSPVLRDQTFPQRVQPAFAIRRSGTGAAGLKQSTTE